MTDECRTILSILNCDYELFKNERNAKEIIDRFYDLLSQGEAEGFYPLIILPSDNLVEFLIDSLENNDFECTPEGMASYRQSIIEKSKQIDAKSFLATTLDEYLKRCTAEDAILGQFEEVESQNELTLHMLAYGRYEEIIIAKLPTKNPWELAAWMPMGGWNECPMPEEQVAVFRYWHEKYGAIPVVVGSDIWEMTLTNPPLTAEEAEKLAKEHFAFDCESETIRGLASALKDSTIWFFWWD